MKNTIVKKLIHIQGIFDGIAILLFAAMFNEIIVRPQRAKNKNKKLKEQINERNINK